jgi:hypothetical protein
VRSERTGGVGVATVPDLIAAWVAGERRHRRRTVAERMVRAVRSNNLADRVSDEVKDEIGDGIWDWELEIMGFSSL